MMHRRDVVRLAGSSALLAAAASPRMSAALAAEDYADGDAAERWMRALIDAPRSLNGPLYLGRFSDRMYFLLEPITWSRDPGDPNFEPVTAPKGFVTDMASIPRIFWSMLPPDGNYAYAAILHDYLYWFQGRPREEADQILKLAMENLKVSGADVAAIYAGVRAGGGGAWKDNAALRTRGERRVLATYPSNPIVRWDDWKQKPGVFATDGAGR